MLRSFFSSLTRRFGARGLERLVGLALLAGLVLLRVIDPAPLEILRLKTFDQLQRIAPRAVTQRVAMIVDIDEESLAAYGQWPWPRTLVADLVERITRAGAVAVAFDVIFAEHDRLSPALIAASLKGLDPALRQGLEKLPSNDEVLAQAMRRSRVVLGQSGYHRKVEQAHEGELKAPPLAMLGGDASPYLFDFPGLIRNVPELEAAAAGRGLVTLVPEIDGVVRRVPVLMKADGVMWPALSIETLRVATGSDAVLVRTGRAGIEGLVIGQAPVATDPNGRVWVHFSPHDQARYVSAKEVLTGSDRLRELAGKLVFIGTSAVGLFDLKATPLEPALPGVEIHTQVIDNILSGGNQLARPGWAIGAELFLAVVIGLMMIAFVPVFGAMVALISGAIVAAGMLFSAFVLFTRYGLVFDAVYPLLSSLIIFACLVIFNYLREEAQKRQIRSAFGQYLSPDLVEQLAADPSKLKLGGETKEMTILFSDVRDFTAISETYKANPQGLTALINRLLTPLSNVVVGHRGTIDKYMGDNIMAFWNAPLDDRSHALHACEAAVDMQSALAAVNEARTAEAVGQGTPPAPLRIGIGINTGECVVGNMGSDLRFDYTVLGDCVNLASRLEGQSKGYGVTVILGESTARQVADDFPVLQLDRIRVKGKSEPEAIFTFVGRREHAKDPAVAELVAAQGAMFAAYCSKRWEEARSILTGARELYRRFGLEKLFDLYQGRISGYEAAPPPEGWDGVYVAETK